MVKTKSTIFHDQIAPKYEAEYSGNFWRLYFDISYANIKKYLPKANSLILDAGGGTGFWSRKLAKKGYNLLCTDIAQKMLDEGIKLAKKEKLDRRIKFLNVDILNMNVFGDNTFDLVIAEGDPVGYSGNPKKAIKELARVAKKGSYVIVSIDSYYSKINRMVMRQDFKQLNMLEKQHKTKFAGGGYYEHDFTVKELKELFTSSGLNVVEIIGKPVFARGIPRDQVEKVLSSKKVYNKILGLELKYNSEPSIVGLAGHIQIVGKKI